jgi:hypothetical protein
MKKPNAFLLLMLCLAVVARAWYSIAFAQPAPNTVPSFTGGPNSSVTASNGVFTNITVSNITLNVGTMTGTGQIATNVLPATYANWLLHQTNGGVPTLSLCLGANSAVTIPSGSVGFWTGTPACDAYGIINITNGNNTGTDVVGYVIFTNTFSHPYLYPPTVTILTESNALSSNLANIGAVAKIGPSATYVVSTTTNWLLLNYQVTQGFTSSSVYSVQYQVQ